MKDARTGHKVIVQSGEFFVVGGATNYFNSDYDSLDWSDLQRCTLKENLTECTFVPEWIYYTDWNGEQYYRRSYVYSRSPQLMFVPYNYCQENNTIV